MEEEMEQAQKEIAEAEDKKKDNFIVTANSKSKVSSKLQSMHDSCYFKRKVDFVRYPLQDVWSPGHPKELQHALDCNFR
jgi:hypothetical protein